MTHNANNTHLDTLITGAVDSDKEIMAIIDFLIMHLGLKKESESDTKKKEEYQHYLKKLNAIDNEMRKKLSLELKQRKQNAAR